jgi:hypothetical protein
LIWSKKHYYDEGPLIQHRKPEDPDSYRKVIILNNVDLFIHTIMDSCLIESQARRLNHYMLRGIRHLHLRNIPGNKYRNQREKVDKAYRETRLNTIIDARNKALI